MIYTCTIDTPLGNMTAAAENEALTGLWFVGQKYYPAHVSDWVHEAHYPVFVSLRDRLSGYFTVQEWPCPIPIAPLGSPFQKLVWDLLLMIPLGEITTYGRIAGSVAGILGVPSMSPQAVGGAVGHNPISILIPCHRVVGSDGSLTGYAGGIDRKAALLSLERRKRNMGGIT